MPRFHGLIRPLVDVNPPRRVVAADAEEIENVIFTIGKGGSSPVKTVNMSGSSSTQNYMDKQQKEITRPTAAVEV